MEAMATEDTMLLAGWELVTSRYIVPIHWLAAEPLICPQYKEDKLGLNLLGQP